MPFSFKTSNLKLNIHNLTPNCPSNLQAQSVQQQQQQQTANANAPNNNNATILNFADPQREAEPRDVVQEPPLVEYKEWKLLSLEGSGEEDAKPSVPSPMKEEEALTALAPSDVHRWTLDRPRVVLMLFCRKSLFFQIS